MLKYVKNLEVVLKFLYICSMKREELSEENKQLLKKHNIDIEFIQNLINNTTCSLHITIEL